MSFHKKQNKYDNVYSEVLVQGRAFIAWICAGRRWTAFFVLHNFGFSKDELENVISRLGDIKRLADNSAGDGLCIVLGDLNFSASSKPGVRLPSYKADLHIGDGARKQHAKLIEALGSFTQILHDEFTHYCPGRDILTDIDHLYLGIPGWKLQHLAMNPWHSEGMLRKCCSGI